MTRPDSVPYRLHYAPDNASLIVRLVLEELGQPFETVLVDRRRGDHHGPAYRALNPNGLIPVLETPQGPLFETGAILLWLSETHPWDASGSRALAPAQGTAARGPFLKWLFWMSNTLHADLRLLFYPQYYIGPDPVQQEQLRATLRGRLRRHLDILEAGGAIPGLDPESPGLLAFYLACLLRWAVLYPVDGPKDWVQLADWPRVQRLLAALETRPSLQAAQRAEGLGPTPFTHPTYATPPEGSAL